MVNDLQIFCLISHKPLNLAILILTKSTPVNKFAGCLSFQWPHIFHRFSRRVFIKLSKLKTMACLFWETNSLYNLHDTASYTKPSTENTGKSGIVSIVFNITVPVRGGLRYQ